jgi:crotonobetainyl-CoA:carnitine CoA-transferase CaiB-like acyl-CoA transferase
MRTVEEFIDHPQLAARDRWREVESPVGPLTALLPPVTVAGREPRMDPIPALGQQTEEILRQLAADRDALAA